jgi:flagellin
MSGIVLTAAVRQNLLSLQSTAELLSTTQGRLESGKKVNSALDNPTNYFTAQGLDNRASDISNLLDSIGNGVQVLQAANTGITALQKLVDSAKSIASQVLQTTVGYTPRSNVSSAPIPGATPTNLLGSGVNATVTGSAIPGAAAPTTKLTALTTAVTAADSLTINGKTIAFANTGTGNAVTSSGGTLDLATATVGDLLAAVDLVTGTAVASTLAGGALTLSTGIAGPLTIGGAGATLTKLGLTAGTTPVGPPPLTGQTLTIAATGGGTPTSIVFGTGIGQISTLNQLNTALSANHLQAGISPSGVLNIVTLNEAASSTIGTIGGSVTNVGGILAGSTSPPAPVADPDSQASRAGLVAQYNNVINQINTTSEDASFNGINLLNGDTLKLVFNETGKSTLDINGVTYNLAGLALAPLNQGVDFLDSSSANRVLTSLNAASTALRSEASALGSNLSIVQIRQDFSKNLINVLQTGSANLTLADTNEEAANSQALSTRQSIAVSALALANQSQQSVLQLLR